MKSNRLFRGPVLWILVLAVALFATINLVQRAAAPEPISFNEFLELAQDGRLTDTDLEAEPLQVGLRSFNITGEYLSLIHI